MWHWPSSYNLSQEHHILLSINFSLSYPDINPRIDLAKISPHILNPERFALHLATFLVSKYAHISKAFVNIEQLRWTRIHIKGDKSVEDNGHPHSFHRDGNDKRVVKVEVSNFNRFLCRYFVTSPSYSLTKVLTKINLSRKWAQVSVIFWVNAIYFTSPSNSMLIQKTLCSTQNNRIVIHQFHSWRIHNPRRSRRPNLLNIHRSRLHIRSYPHPISHRWEEAGFHSTYSERWGRIWRECMGWWSSWACEIGYVGDFCHRWQC